MYVHHKTLLNAQYRAPLYVQHDTLHSSAHECDTRLYVQYNAPLYKRFYGLPSAPINNALDDLLLGYRVQLRSYIIKWGGGLWKG